MAENGIVPSKKIKDSKIQEEVSGKLQNFSSLRWETNFSCFLDNENLKWNYKSRWEISSTIEANYCSWKNQQNSCEKPEALWFFTNWLQSD